MARTSITTARYNPFTMEELYSPVLRATEQHLKQQEKYDELANQMNVWKYRLPQNSEARDLYDAYEKRFNAAVDDLNANGINNPSARDNARALIRENPIPAFIETQKQLDQINDTANKLNPTTTRWIHRPTFDDVLHGNTTMDYVDINDIEKKASDNIASVARTIVQEPTFKKATGAGGQYFITDSTTGITDAMWQMANDRKAGKDFGNELNGQLDRLNNTVDNIYKYARYDEFSNNEQAQSDVEGAIQRGLLNGSAITSYGVQRDNSNEMALRWAEENRAATKFNQEQKEYNRYHNPDGSINYGAYYADKAAEQAEIDKYWKENNLPEDEKPNVFTNTYGTKTKSTTTTTSKKSSSGGSTPKPRVPLVNPGLYSTSKNESGVYSPSSYIGTAESDYTDKFNKIADKYTPPINLNALNNGLDITLSDDASNAIRKGKNPAITYISKGKGRISSWELREQVEAITGMSPTEADKYYQITAYVNPEGELKFNIQHRKDTQVRTDGTEQSTETEEQEGSNTSGVVIP